MSLKTLEEMLIAHVGTKYVKTGRGARSTFFGIDIWRDVDGHYEFEFVVGGGRFKSATAEWSPITFAVVQGLLAQVSAGFFDCCLQEIVDERLVHRLSGDEETTNLARFGNGSWPILGRKLLNFQHAAQRAWISMRK